MRKLILVFLAFILVSAFGMKVRSKLDTDATGIHLMNE